MIARPGSIAALTLGVTLGSAACSSDAHDPAATIGTVRQAILGGSVSDDAQDAVVMLVVTDPVKNRRLGICTATLIAPRLVLTARHCLAETNDEVACDSDGTPLIGGQIRGNRDPAQFFVFTGKTRPDFIGDIDSTPFDPTRWKPAGQGAEIIDDRSGTLCNHDIGLLLLKEPIQATVATIRLDGEPEKGEGLLTVGWGVASDAVEPKMRRQRGEVTVKRVGPDESIPTLTRSEFLFEESICLGDSGGPVFAAATSAVIGVVSRGGNGAPPGGGPASTCVGANNLATKLAPFRELLLEGFTRAGAEPRLEPAKADDGCSAAPLGSRRSPSLFVFALSVGLAAAAGARRREKEGALKKSSAVLYR